MFFFFVILLFVILFSCRFPFFVFVKFLFREMFVFRDLCSFFCLHDLLFCFFRPVLRHLSFCMFLLILFFFHPLFSPCVLSRMSLKIGPKHFGLLSGQKLQFHKKAWKNRKWNIKKIDENVRRRRNGKRKKSIIIEKNMVSASEVAVTSL